MNYQQQDENKFQEELNRFIRVLKCEILSPDIVAFEKQVFSYLNKALKEREQLLKRLKPDLEQQDSDSNIKNLRNLVFKCEVEKVGYLLKEYLRIRLKKIQKFGLYLYKNQNIVEKKLSENEYIFLKKYAELKFKYFQQNTLKNFPKSYRGMAGLESSFTKNKDIPLQLDTKQSHVVLFEPQPNQYVFCTIKANPDLYRFNSDITVVNVEEKSIIPINSTIYTQYKSVSKMISQGNAVLV